MAGHDNGGNRRIGWTMAPDTPRVTYELSEYFVKKQQKVQRFNIPNLNIESGGQLTKIPSGVTYELPGY